MVACASVCLRRLAGERSQVVRFGRWLANPKVTAERIVAGWGESTAEVVSGRHVLALQDTSEILFRTTAARRRGLGEIGRGAGHGVLLHAMLAIDAADGQCLGLVAGRVWTRAGRVTVPHDERPLGDKESSRWLETAEAAKRVLSPAARVTVVADRESDIYAEWARLPGPGFDLITRAMRDRVLAVPRGAPAGERKLSTVAAGWPEAGRRVVGLRERARRPAHDAVLTLRFGPVAIRQPRHRRDPGLPRSVPLTLVEVREVDPPPGAEPVLWRLLTTHAVPDAAMAWQIVDWYRARWAIEQLFRVLKRQGLMVEDSQLDDAAHLVKLVAVAARAAAVTLQLVHARDGTAPAPASRAFDPPERAALRALATTLQGRTPKQRNPHPTDSLAWAAWIVARLGGWTGYASERPPGPITFRHGLERFRAIALGFALQHVCIP